MSGARNSAPHSPPGNTSSVLLIGFEAQARQIIASWQPTVAALVTLPTLEASKPRLVQGPAVVCFGPGVPPGAVAAFLAQQAVAPRDTRYLVLAAGSDLDRFQPFVEGDQLFYLCAQPPAVEAVVALLAAACEHGTSALNDATTAPAGEILRQIEALEQARDLDETLDRLEEAARALVPCRRATGRWVDAETQTVWRPGDGGKWDSGETRDSVVAGLVGFVARTGESICVPRVGEDPRYDADADNSRRSPRERFLAVALPAGAGAANPTVVEAVLNVARGGREAPFDAADQGKLEHLGREAGPILRRRRQAAELARVERETAVFRRAALAHREEGLRTRAEPLRIVPTWLVQAYRAVLVMCVVTLLAVPFVGSAELAVGSAVVRLAARTEVRARAAGVLEALHVRAGDRVQRGQEVGRLESAEEEAALAQLQQELTLRLVERLRHPEQSAATAAFVTLRERQRVVAAQLERRRLRAPQDGVVGDLLARAGRPLAAGQPVLSLTTSEVAAKPSIDILLPGRFRPLLAPGMAVRFKIDGYPDVEQHLEVGQISHQVITHQQMREILAPTANSTMEGQAGLVIVRAALPAASFDSAGQRYAYFDGMTGTAALRLRKKRWVTDWLRRRG